MKSSFALLFLSVSLCHSGTLPTFRDVPGHLVDNQCDPFSRAAVLKLHKAGIPAVRILMRVQNPLALSYHAALVFKQDGKFYVMDNEHREPMQFKGKTELSAAIRLVGPGFYTSVCMTDECSHKVPPRKLGDLFKPNPAWLDSVRIK